MWSLDRADLELRTSRMQAMQDVQSVGNLFDWFYHVSHDRGHFFATALEEEVLPPMRPLKLQKVPHCSVQGSMMAHDLIYMSSAC